MQHHPTEFKLKHLISALIIALISVSLLIFSSLTLHYQLDKKTQLENLLKYEQSSIPNLSPAELKKHLHNQWQIFQLSYPATELAIVEFSDSGSKVIFSSFQNTPQSHQSSLNERILQLSEKRLLETPKDQDSSIVEFLNQQWQSFLDSEQFHLQSFMPENGWYLATYQPHNWLPSFAQKSLSTTLTILAITITMIAFAFFFSLQKTTKRLNSTQERYQQFLNQNLDWVWETDTQGIIIYSSDHSFNLLGIDANRLLGISLFSLIEQTYHPEEIKKLRHALTQTDPFFNLEFALKHSSKKHIYGVFYGQPFFDNHNQLLGFRGTCRNISAYKERQNALIEQLNFDPVTQLPNRVYLMNSLNRLYQSKVAGQHYALILLDLNGLQEVNDFHGHRYSTLALHLSAERIRKTVAQKNLVCHLNGTEFAVLIRTPHATKKSITAQMELLAEELIYELEQTMIFEEHSIMLKANIGIALIPENGNQVPKILSSANQALHESKQTGYGRYQFASTDPTNYEQAHYKTAEQLKTALEKNQFKVKYQLQVNTLQQKIIGLEALLRWQDPETKKIIPAGEFIHIAEEMNQIIDLDIWMLKHVFQDGQQLISQLRLHPQETDKLPTIVINLSSDTLISERLKPTLQQLIKTTDFPVQKLRFEISENQLVRHANKAACAINELSEMGIKFSIDQFGTGWSNLSYLQSLPISFIKIDKSNISDIANNPQSMKLTKTLIQMAHSLQIEVIAEGVECDSQKHLLQQNGCIFMQGYLFSDIISLSKVQSIIEHNLNDQPIPN